MLMLREFSLFMSLFTLRCPLCFLWRACSSSAVTVSPAAVLKWLRLDCVSPHGVMGEQTCSPPPHVGCPSRSRGQSWFWDHVSSSLSWKSLLPVGGSWQLFQFASRPPQLLSLCKLWFSFSHFSHTLLEPDEWVDVRGPTLMFLPPGAPELTQPSVDSLLIRSSCDVTKGPFPEPSD